MSTFIFARIFKHILESLALASSLFVLGLEATCPWQLGLWFRDFFKVLGLGLEGCVLTVTFVDYVFFNLYLFKVSSKRNFSLPFGD